MVNKWPKIHMMFVHYVNGLIMKGPERNDLPCIYRGDV